MPSGAVRPAGTHRLPPAGPKSVLWKHPVLFSCRFVSIFQSFLLLVAMFACCLIVCVGMLVSLYVPLFVCRSLCVVCAGASQEGACVTLRSSCLHWHHLSLRVGGYNVMSTLRDSPRCFLELSADRASLGASVFACTCLRLSRYIHKLLECAHIHSSTPIMSPRLGRNHSRIWMSENYNHLPLLFDYLFVACLHS